MPDNKQYFVQLPAEGDALAEEKIVDAQSFDKHKDQLFNTYKNAQVKELSPIKMGEQFDYRPDDEFEVSLDDGEKKVVSAGQFVKNLDKLYQNYPTAQVTRRRNVNYWGDKLGEIENRIGSLKKEMENLPKDEATDIAKGMNLEDADLMADDIIAASSASASQQGALKRRKDIKNELDQLYRMRENNYAYQQFWAGQAKETEDAIKDIDARRQKLAKKIASGEKLNTMLGQGTNAGYQPRTQRDENMLQQQATLTAAKHLLEDAHKTALAPSRYGGDDHGAWHDFWQGMKDGALDAITVVSLGKVMDQASTLVPLLKRAQDVIGKNNSIIDFVNDELDGLANFTPEEKILLHAFVKKAEIEGGRGETLSRSYQAGQSAIQSAGFMADFALAGGIGEAAAKAVVGNAVKAAGKNALKKIGTESLYGLIKAGAMTPFMPSFYANAANNIMQFNDAGGVDLSGKAILRAGVDGLIENVSETIGGKPLELLAIPAEKIKFFAWGKAMRNSPWMQSLKQAGWNGLFEEYVEEWTGNALRVMTGVDKNALKDFATVDQQLVTLGAFAPMTLLGGGVTIPKMIGGSKVLANKSKELQAVLGEKMDETAVAAAVNVGDIQSPEDLGKHMGDVYKQAVEAGVDPATAYRSVMEFTDAAAKYNVLKGMFEEQKDIDRSRELLKTNKQMGGESWYHEGANGANFVRTITDADGNERFVVGDAEEMLALVDKDGKKSTLSYEKLQEGVEAGVLTDSGERYLNDYLDEQTNADRKQKETERMATEAQRNAQELYARAQIGTEINIGSPENVNNGIIRGIQGGMFIVEAADGVHRLSEEEMMSKLGMQTRPMTDAEIEEKEADDVIRQQDLRKKANEAKGINVASVLGLEGEAILDRVFEPQRHADGTTTFQITYNINGKEAIAFVDEDQLTQIVSLAEQKPVAEVQTEEQAQQPASSVPTDFRGNPLPMRTDTTTGRQEVDENSLWDNDPEAWAHWNDANPEQVVSSQEKLEYSIASLNTQIAENTAALRQAVLDNAPAEQKDQIKANLSRIKQRLGQLAEILGKYTAPTPAAEQLAPATEQVGEQVVNKSEQVGEAQPAPAETPARPAIGVISKEILRDIQNRKGRSDGDLREAANSLPDKWHENLTIALKSTNAEEQAAAISELIEISRKNAGNAAADAVLSGVTQFEAPEINPVQQAIEAARQEVDTNPTEAQKEAGNYKKGHITLDGYDITLENPKGSVRSGVDASGKEWSQVMNNDYGYIRMTEGVDGDHIDVFLSDHPEQGNVFVVDQVDPQTKEFDEHKVMYGFNSAEEAAAAYLSNYEKGWQGLGAITEVTKDEFKKWVNSSTRKTKPFAEYKSVNAISGQNAGATATQEVEAAAEQVQDLDAVLADKGRTAILKRIDKWKKLLGDVFVVHDDISTVTNEAALARIREEDKKVADGEPRDVHAVRGWYEPETGKAHIYLPHLLEMTDRKGNLDETILHEVVSHKGLRALQGRHFNEFMDIVWGKLMTPAQQQYYLDYVNGTADSQRSRRAAADEFLAHAAEKNQAIVKEVDATFWTRLADAFKDFINTIFGEQVFKEADTDWFSQMLQAAAEAVREESEAVQGEESETRMSVLSNIESELDKDGISIDDKALLDAYGLKNVTLSKHNDVVTLTHFIANERGKGNGTRFMTDLVQLADQNGWTLALTPDTTFGATSVGRLKDFYKRFGFRENKGRNADYAISESMIRTPGMPSDTRFSIRTKPAPKKTGIGYKAFYRGKDGRLYPAMVANPDGAPFLEKIWLDADMGEDAGTSKTGRRKVKAGGKGTRGGGGTLSFRPGFHLGEIPYALQFNVGPKVDNPLGIRNQKGEIIKVGKYFPKDLVWAEVEYAADKDYQEEAMSYGRNEAGNFQHSLAGLPRIPEDGYYKYRTNANPATDPWIITGAMKIKRVLSNEEVDDLVRAAGREPQLREDSPAQRLEQEGFSVDEKNDDVRFSVRYSPDEKEAKQVVKNIAAETGRSLNTAKRWVKSEMSLAAIILDEMNAPYLDYVPDERFAAIKKDSDYPQGTVDFNNICRKRIEFTNLYQRIQKAYPNVIITGEDLATIRDMMKKRGITVACGLCYVEDRRQLLGEIAKSFIDELKGNFENYAKGTATKAKNAEKFRELLGDDKKNDLNIYDLITLEGSTKLSQEHPGIYAAFQAFNNARGQQSGNLFEGYAEYKREILKWSPAKVKSVNDNGGLRVFSYSDFEAHHLIDLVQIIQDCATKGVMVQGYTKVPAFARAVANTNIKLNRSLIPLGDTGIVDGKLAYDPVEGIDINDKDFLESNDNVGNILIGINDEQIRLAMADPFVHYIIPYHSNQSGVLRQMKQTGAWTNYKNEQTDKGSDVGKHGVNIYTDVLAAAEKEGKPIRNEKQFVEKFLSVCKERGWTPRFERFLNKNKKGDYVYTPGYYKLLLDFKLFDEQGRILPQKPVVAEFDDEFNAKILNDYVAGEKTKNSKELDKAYNDIVKALNLDERENDVRFSVTDTPAFKKWFGDSKVVDENGKPLVVYHGSYSKGIEAFDNRHKWSDAPDNTFWFSSKRSNAETYRENGGDLVEAYLSIKNPLVIDARGANWNQLPARYEVYIDKKDGDEIDQYFDTYDEALRFAEENGGTAKDIVLEGEVDTNEYAKRAMEKGYDGLIVRNVSDLYGKLEKDNATFEEETSDVYAAFAPNQIKSVDNNGDWNPADDRIRFSVVSKEQDEKYLAAVEAGDMEKATQMVKEAAKAAMPYTEAKDKDGYPLVVYHGTNSNKFTEFLKPGEDLSGLIWTTPDRRYAESYIYLGKNPSMHTESLAEKDNGNGRLYHLYVDVKNPLDIGYIEDVVGSESWNRIAESLALTPEELFYKIEEKRYGVPADYQQAVKQMSYIFDYTRQAGFVNLLKQYGYDGVIAEENGVNKILTYGVISPSQVKSAESVVYDDNGKVIPLSERFNQQSDDIRFSVSSRNAAQSLYDAYENQDGEEYPWMSNGELVDRIEAELPRTEETRDLFALVDRYHALAEEDFNEGRRDFAGGEMADLFDAITSDLERLANPSPRFSITTYHGSGADFDRFDHSHMGEGEGGQSYGYGTYVSTNRNTGLQYARTIGGAEDGRLYKVEIPDDNGQNYLHWDEYLTKEQCKKIIDAVREQMKKDGSWYDEAENELKSSLGYGTVGRYVEGSLDYFLGDMKNYATGEDPGAKRNAELLKSLGIIGMEIPVDRKGGQRYAGSNYVIFDDADLNIVEKTKIAERIASADTKQKVADGKGEALDQADIDEVRFSLSRNNKAIVSRWLEKRTDLSKEERSSVLDYIDGLDNAKLQLATARWFAGGTIRLPEDMEKVQQAVSVAEKAKVDPLQYSSPMELLDSHADFKPSEKRINPDEVSTLHRGKEIPEHGIVIYDVDESDESRENMRQIINTHFGKDASPWCLLQGDGEGNLTEYSEGYWNHYNAYPKQVAFKDGKLLSFSANDSKERVWWDKQDAPHRGIPITMKMPNDELKRTATYELREDGSLGNPTNIYRGNKRNGLYEEWLIEDGKEILIERSHRKDGVFDGPFERYYSNGNPSTITTYRDGHTIGEWTRYHNDGSVYMKYHFDEYGQRDGEQIIYGDNGHMKHRSFASHGLDEGLSEFWDEAGTLRRRENYHEGKLNGLYEQFYENGKREFAINYKGGHRNGLSEGWYKNGQLKTRYYSRDGIQVGRYEGWHEDGTPEYVYNYDENGEEHGVLEEYRGDGQIQHRQHYVHGKKEGLDEYWHPNGQLQFQMIFKDGKKDGLFQSFYEDGQIRERKTYIDDKLNGVDEEYHRDGRLWRRWLMKDGVRVEDLGTDGLSPYDYNSDDEGIRYSVTNMNQETFVSNAQAAVENIQNEKATPEQWLNQLTKNGGLKAAEDKWLGLSDWLKAQENIDKWYDGIQAVAKYDDESRKIAHGIKDGDEKAITKAAAEMAKNIEAGDILVPIPSSNGRAESSLALAQKIVEIAGKGEVADVLEGIPRESLYVMKKEGKDLPAPSELGIDQILNSFLPTTGRILLIDNVAATGTTMRAAMDVIPEAQALVYAKDESAFPRKKTVTKQEILDFIEQNRIQIEEEHYADLEYSGLLDGFQQEYDTIPFDDNEALWEEADNRVAEFYEEMEEKYGEDYLDEMNESERITEERLLDEREKYAGEQDVYQAAFDAMVEKYGDDFSLAFGQVGGKLYVNDSNAAAYFLGVKQIDRTREGYTTDGLDNKREIALTVPTIEPYNENDDIHFGDAGEGRAVAWARFGDTSVSAAVSAAKKAYEDADKAWRDYKQEVTNKYALKATGTKSVKDLATPEENARVQELYLASVAAENEWRHGRHAREKVLFIDEIQSKRHQDARELGGYKDDTLLKQAEAARDAKREELDRFLLDMDAKYKNAEAEHQMDVYSDEDRAEYQRLYREWRNAEDRVARKGFDPMDDEEYRRMVAEHDAMQDNPEMKQIAKEWTEVVAEMSPYYKMQYSSEEEEKKRAEAALKPLLKRREKLEAELKPYQDASQELLERIGERQRELVREFNEAHKSNVPAAPFEKNWHELTMKRMLRLAAEEGYDYVAWTTGDQQAERYNIGGILNSIERRESNDIHERDFVLNLNDHGTQYITTDDNGKVIHTIVDDFKDKSLSQIVGKELAVKMMSMEENDTIEGDGLRVGGEGMKGFYDGILVNFMNKYGKKWGVKVEDLEIPGIGTEHAVPITAEMRESVMEGQPMFSVVNNNSKAVKGVVDQEPFSKRLDENNEALRGATPNSSEYDAIVAERVQIFNDYYQAIGDGNDGVEVIALKNFRDRLKGIKKPNDNLDIDRTVEKAKKRGMGYTYGEYAFVFPENINTIELAREIFVHERQHRDTNLVPGLKKRLAMAYGWDGVGSDVASFNNYNESLYLAKDIALETLKKLAPEKASFYFTSPLRSIVSEILSFAQQNAYNDKNIFNKLKNDYLVPQEVIDVIQQFYEDRTNAGNSLRGVTRWRVNDDRIVKGGAEANGDASGAEPGEERLGASEFTGRRVAAENVANLLGVEVEFKPAAEMTTANGKHLAGRWQDGRISVCVENCRSADDAVRTVIHEAVGHNGLRKLVGAQDMRAFALTLYRQLPAAARREITDAAFSQYGGNIVEAVEEWLAECSEDMSFDKYEDLTAWDRVRDAVRRLFARFGIGPRLTDNDIRWILWQSYYANKEEDLPLMARRFTLAHRLGFSASQQDDRSLAQSVTRNKVAEEVSAARLYNMAVQSAKARLHEVFVDKDDAVNRLVEAIEKSSGKPAQDFEDVRLALNQQSSKGLAATEKFIREKYNPMMEAIKAIVKEGALSVEDIERYVKIKHGIERNEVFAKRDARNYYKTLAEKEIKRIKESDAEPDIKDSLISREKSKLDKHLERINNGTDGKYKEFRQKDYGGLTSMYSDYDAIEPYKEGVESYEEYQARALKARHPMYETLEETEEAAAKEVRSFEESVGSNLTDELWKRINAATKATLLEQYKSNMMGKRQYETVRDMFKYYVPLRGFKDNQASDMYNYYMSDNSGEFTPPLLKAGGRKTESESPFGYIGSMASSAITEGVKNQSKLALYYFITNRPDNDLMSASEVWYENTGMTEDGKRIFEPVYPPLNEDLSSESARKAYADWEKSMEAKAKQGFAYKGTKDIDLNDSVIHIDDKQKNEHIIRFKVNGEDKMMFINGNPRAAQAINNMLNINAAPSELVNALQKVLRYVAMINTQLNPEFWMTNMQRDLLFATMSESVKGDKAFNDAFRRNLMEARKVIKMRNAYNNNTLGDSPMENLYREFVENGGVTGYSRVIGTEEWEREIRKFNKDERKVIAAAKDVFDAIGGFGEAIEQLTRFAAYKTSREAGKGVIESVADAKELTVNFNRKGSGIAVTFDEAAKLRGADGKPLSKLEQALVVAASSLGAYGRAAIVFFNAAVQGLNNMVQLAKKQPKTMAIWTAAYFTLGVLNAALHAMLDDPDDDDYLDMPADERGNNLVLGGKGVYLKWALPQEMRVFYRLGDVLVNHILGRTPNKSVLGEMMHSVGEVSPIDFSSGISALAPSVASPIVEIIRNEDWTGGRVYNDRKYMTKGEAQHHPKYTDPLKNTPEAYIAISKALNAISGGNAYEAGKVNVDPNVLEHLFEGYTGGAGTSVEKLMAFLGNAAQGKFVVRNTPFLRRLLSISDERYRNAHVTELYYYYKDEAESTKRIYKKALKAGDEKMIEKLQRNGDLAVMEIYESYRKPMKTLDDDLKATLEKDTDQRRAIMRQQDAMRKEMIKQISELK